MKSNRAIFGLLSLVVATAGYAGNALDEPGAEAAPEANAFASRCSHAESVFDGLGEAKDRAAAQLIFDTNGAVFRDLSREEKKTLEAVFRGSLKTKLLKLRLLPSGNAGAGLKPPIGSLSVIELTRYWRDDPQFDEDGRLTEVGMANLVHEAVHAWQSQNGRSFLERTASARARAQALVASLDPQPEDPAYEAESRLYDWRSYRDRGLAFEQLNHEAQARLVEDWYKDRSLAGGEGGRYVRTALASLRACSVDP